MAHTILLTTEMRFRVIAALAVELQTWSPRDYYLLVQLQRALGDTEELTGCIEALNEVVAEHAPDVYRDWWDFERQNSRDYPVHCLSMVAKAIEWVATPKS